MAILMPAVMRFNLPKCCQRYGELLLPLAGAQVYAATSLEDRGEKTIQVLTDLRQELADLTGLPTTLQKTGKVRREDFELVARTALNDGAMIVNLV